MLVLDIAYLIYLKFEEYPNALQIALFLDNLQVWHWNSLIIVIDFLFIDYPYTVNCKEPIFLKCVP